MMSWLGEFLELARLHERGEKVEKVCESLRRLGFSNSELSSLSGTEYPTSSINRWTKGVTVTSSVEKDELMSELRGFVEGGHRVGDLEDYKKAESLLGKKGVSLERIIGFVEEVDSVESTPTDLHCLIVQLRDSKMMVDDVKRGLETQRDLADVGLGVRVQQVLVRAAKKYGTAEGVLEAINAAGSIEEAILLTAQEREKAKGLIESQARAEAEFNRLEVGSAHLKADIAFAKSLREKYHFDQSSMGELRGLAEKHGSVTGVIGALNAYADVKRIRGEVEEAEARKSAVESEISSLSGERDQIQSTISTLNQTLGVMDQLTKSSSQIMVLAQLTLRPRDVTADDYEIARLVSALLGGVQERAVRSSMDPKLQRVMKNEVRIAAMALDLYLRNASDR